VKKYLVVVFAFLSASLAAQSLVSRSNEFQLDMNANKNITGGIPSITWEKPIPDISFSEDGKFGLKVVVESTTPLKSVELSIRASDQRTVKGKQTLQPAATEQNKFTIEKNLTLSDGENHVFIVAETSGGIKSSSYRKVVVGSEAIANISRIDRDDYALLFATDNYEYWGDLVNPVFDARTIAEDLRKNFGFKVEVVENATQAEILKKLREYAEKKYRSMDQLLIFFAGHGQFDQTFGEGYVVTTESLMNDEGKTSYLSHNRLRSIINNIPCDHVLLTMDVCFSGTFDEELASARGADDEIYKQQDRSVFITRKLVAKTRKYLTSGGKTYVSDGIAGQHSPFAKAFLEGLASRGGSDGIITMPELFTFVEKLKIQPRTGNFGDNAPGSDFLIIAK
jgi:hypothetical protein